MSFMRLLFFNEIKKNIHLYVDDYKININEETKTELELYIDDVLVDDNNIKEILENEYNNFYYDPNSKIIIKLKLGLKIFLLINHVLFPSLN